jgi:hypothetical protein
MSLSSAVNVSNGYKFYDVDCRLEDHRNAGVRNRGRGEVGGQEKDRERQSGQRLRTKCVLTFH